MIGLPAGTRIWLAAGITDMRAGMNGLAAKVETALAEDRTAAMCSCSVDAVATCSRYCGGPGMVCVCWQSALNAAALSGRRQTAAASP
jgi:transposase